MQGKCPTDNTMKNKNILFRNGVHCGHPVFSAGLPKGGEGAQKIKTPWILTIIKPNKNLMASLKGGQ